MPYHHGNLRDVLIESALELIGERGPAGFTLREVARQAGVSHTAPYRHFPSKDHLLAAAGARGYIHLMAAMREEMARATSARRRLEAGGLAYVAFALHHPSEFAAMFDSDLRESDHPEWAEAARGAFEILLQAVREARAERKMPERDPTPAALRAWSLVHGISKLAVTRRLPFGSPDEVLAFAAQVLHGGGDPCIGPDEQTG